MRLPAWRSFGRTEPAAHVTGCDRTALRLDESDQVDMVLGDGARDRGALADQISPLPEVGAGVGYVRLEASPDPVRVRAAYITDEDIWAMAAAVGGLPGGAL
jgi:S-DNA-T family DNA segregation ATPase FtsK/SpoIIIE